MSSIEENVKAMLPQITMEVVAAIKEQALRNLQYTTATAIQEAVTEYVKTEVLPAVKDELRANDAVMKAAILASTKGVAELLCESIVDSARKKLAAYDGDKLVASVFGPLFRSY